MPDTPFHCAVKPEAVIAVADTATGAGGKVNTLEFDVLVEF
jgi:hypothetical protein